MRIIRNTINSHSRSWRELHKIGEFAVDAKHRNLRRSVAKAQLEKAGVGLRWKGRSRFAELWREYGVTPKAIAKLCEKECEKKEQKRRLRTTRNV